SSDAFSGSLETHIEALQLRSIRKNDQNFQLTIRARARLTNAANGQTVAERSYQSTSGEAMFIDWARAGCLERVAQTGFRQIAQDIARDFCSPTLEAPIFLGAAYGSPRALPTQGLRSATRNSPGTTRVQFVD